MPFALALLIVASTAWLAIDASKRDWSDNGFAKNVPTWVAGALILWIVVFPLYVLVHRKKAPLLKLNDLPPHRGQNASEVPPLEPEVVAEPEPVVEVEPEPVVEVEPEPEPVVEAQPEPEVEAEALALNWAALAEADQELAPLEVPQESRPVIEEAPAGLSLDAFKDIKPFAFGASDVEPEPVTDLETEPTAEPAPEPEPLVATTPAPAPAASPPKTKRGSKLPRLELKLPKLGSLPSQLQGPLNELERKIALGSAVAIVAAAALGYMSAPKDDAGAPAPTPAPAISAR